MSEYKEPMELDAAYKVADALYAAGYKDRHNERDYDPRKCPEWQAVVDPLIEQAAPEAAADWLNTILWMYRRLPQAYGRPPFIEQSIMTLAKQVGQDVTHELRERVVRTAVHEHGARQATPAVPYRVAEFWSSATAGKKVRMLAEGVDIVEWAKRDDFIRWVDAPPVAAPEAPVGDMVFLPRAIVDSTLAALRKAQMFKVSTALSNAISPVAAPEAPAHFCATCGKRLFTGSIHTCTPPAATTASASDGAIYEQVSRRADPEGHAEAMAQMDEVLGAATTTSASEESPLGPRRWSKEPEMMESWSAPATAKPAYTRTDAMLAFSAMCDTSLITRPAAEAMRDTLCAAVETPAIHPKAGTSDA